MKEQYISQSDGKEILDELGKNTQEEYFDQQKIEYEKLKRVALDFLNAYEIYRKNRGMKQRLSNLLKTMEMDKIISQDSYNLLKNRGRSADSIRNKYLYIKAFQFQEELDKYLEKAPSSVLYVMKDDNGNYSTFKLNYIELAMMSSAQGKITGVKSYLKNLEEKKSIESTDKFEDEHVLFAQNAIKGVECRLERYREVTGKDLKGALLMWKVLHNWVVAVIPNMGVVKEAYVAALLKEHNTLKDLCVVGSYSEGGVYRPHTLISYFYENFISKVDNLGEIQGRDIETKDQLYSVKSDSAGLPGIIQYKRTAEEIINNNFLNSKEIEIFFKTELQKNPSYLTKILSFGNSIAEKEANKIFDEKQIKALNRKITLT